jgi:hypothetical protein
VRRAIGRAEPLQRLRLGGECPGAVQECGADLRLPLPIAEARIRTDAQPIARVAAEERHGWRRRAERERENAALVQAARAIAGDHRLEAALAQDVDFERERVSVRALFDKEQHADRSAFEPAVESEIQRTAAVAR